MEIIKMKSLSKQRWEHIRPYLDEHLLGLQRFSFLHTYYHEPDGYTVLKITRYPDHIRIKDLLDLYFHSFCQAVAEYLVEEFEKEWIRHLIQIDFGFVQTDQQEEIYQYCFQELFLDEKFQKRDEWKIAKRKNKIFQKLLEVVQDEEEVNLEGIIRFRLYDYTEELYQTIEYAINEYIIEQEYHEFIQLIQMFISKQEPKVPFLHVHHIEDRKFKMYYEDGTQLTDQELESYLKQWSEQSVSQEDLIVSTLIAIAPKRMVVHTREPKHTTIQTLKNIFQHRMSICTKCYDCGQWDKELIAAKCSSHDDYVNR